MLPIMAIERFRGAMETYFRETAARKLIEAGEDLIAAGERLKGGGEEDCGQHLVLSARKSSEVEKLRAAIDQVNQWTKDFSDLLKREGISLPPESVLYPQSFPELLTEFEDKEKGAKIAKLKKLRAALGKSELFDLTEGQKALPLSDIGLRTRTYFCLSRHRVGKVGDVITMSVEDLLLVRNFGTVALEDLLGGLLANGILPREVEIPGDSTSGGVQD